MAEKAPAVSVVIPVGPESACLGRCLEAVTRQNLDDMEILLVCDPRASQLTTLPTETEAVRVLWERHTCTTGHLVNMGMKAARGKIRVMLMPDCTPVGEGWLRGMTAPFEDEHVGVVVSQCILPDGGALGVPAALLDTVVPMLRSKQDADADGRQSVSNLCDAYRDRLLEGVGYFAAEDLPPAGQAVDISLKVAGAGYDVRVSDSAVVMYSAPRSRTRLGGVLRQALDLGRADAALDKLYELRWLNAGIPAAALVSLLLLPMALVSLPVAWAVAFGLFVMGMFLAVRVPVLGWECPAAVITFAAYAGIVILVRDGWWPGVLGRTVHPAVIRQWLWLAAVTGSLFLLVLGSAMASAVRACRRPGGVRHAVPVFLVGIVWWLLTGLGYLQGRMLGRRRGA